MIDSRKTKIHKAPGFLTNELNEKVSKSKNLTGYVKKKNGGSQRVAGNIISVRTVSHNRPIVSSSSDSSSSLSSANSVSGNNISKGSQAHSSQQKNCASTLSSVGTNIHNIVGIATVAAHVNKTRLPILDSKSPTPYLSSASATAFSTKRMSSSFAESDSTSNNDPTDKVCLLQHQPQPIQNQTVANLRAVSAGSIGHLEAAQDESARNTLALSSPLFSSSLAASGPVNVTNVQNDNQSSTTAGLTIISSRALSMPLRRGKWTLEEETYVARVIRDFNSGYLNAPAGTTLRTYLSEKLHCDPMRITKKFTGDACIGKRVFHPAVRCGANGAAIDKAQAELDSLEKRWRSRLETQQRESSKKSNRHSMQYTGVSPHSIGGILPPSQQVVAQTASWLDRASTILSSSSSSTPDQQMREVRQLIDEGPAIQQTSAGIPMLFRNDSHTSLIGTHPVLNINSVVPENYVSETRIPPCPSIPTKRKVSEVGCHMSNGKLNSPHLEQCGGASNITLPQASNCAQNAAPTVGSNARHICNDTRTITNISSTNTFSAQASCSEAEALVGFLNCVHKESRQGKLPEMISRFKR